MSGGNYAGMATNIIGSELQGWAALLDKWNMQDAMAAEIRRQDKYAGQAGVVFDKNVQDTGAQGFQNNMAQASQNRQGTYSNLAALPSSVAQPGAMNSLQSQRDQAANMESGKRRAGLESYSDAVFKNSMANLGSQRGLDKITNFAGGTASVFPYRMYEAQHSNDILAEVGAAISSIGGGQGTNWSQQNQPPSALQNYNQMAQQSPYQSSQYYYSPQTPYGVGASDSSPIYGGYTGIY